MEQDEENENGRESEDRYSQMCSRRGGMKFDALVLAAVRPSERDTPWALLRVHHNETRGDRRDRHVRWRLEIRPRNDEVEIPRAVKLRGDVLEVETLQLWQCACDEPEHVVVLVPRNLEVLFVARALELSAALPSLSQVVSVHVGKLVLASCEAGVGVLELLVQRCEHIVHGIVLTIAPQPRRLVQAFEPLLTPENGDSDELVRDKSRLINQVRTGRFPGWQWWWW
jgi:hypothetical protein